MTRWCALVGTALLMALTGCADDRGTPSSAPAAASSTAEASSEPAAESPLPCVAGVESVAAEGEVDADDAMAAYCVVADLVREHGFTDAVRPGTLELRDLRAVRPLLTPDARQRWGADTAAWLFRQDPAAGERISGLVLHDVEELPRGYVLDPPWIHGTEVGEPTAEARGGALRLEVTSTSGIVLAKRGDAGGRHSVLPVTRAATYVLRKVGEEWMVDRWSARTTYGEPRLVSG